MAQIILDSNNNLIQGDFDNATLNNRTKLQTTTTNATTNVYVVPNGSSTSAGVSVANNSSLTNASKIVMATNGTTDTQIISGVNGSGTYLPLSFYTNNALAMQVDTGGNVLVGTASQVQAGKFCVQADLNAFNGMVINDSGSAVSVAYSYFSRGAVLKGSITYNSGSNLVAYNTSSDYRLKENIIDLPNALQTVSNLKPRQFDWKETGNTTTGFIAHELAEVLPHAVTGEKDAVDADGNPKYQGVDTSFLVATLTKAIQEQQAIINELKTRIEALESK